MLSLISGWWLSKLLVEGRGGLEGQVSSRASYNTCPMDNCSLRGRVNAWRGGFIEGALPLAPNYWKLCWSWSKVLFYFPLPFGLNLATLQLCAWWMFLSYTNSWGAPIVGPGLFWTFTIFSHHSFKCIDPPPPESESKVGLYSQNRKWFFVMGSRTIPDAVLCFDHGTHISRLLNTIYPRIGWLNKKECERCIFPVVSWWRKTEK